MTKPYEIICGDCLKVLPDLTRGGNKATLIFADSPYNLGLNYGATTNDKRSDKDFLYWCECWIAECYMNLLSNGSLWLLINHEYAAYIELLIRSSGFTIVNWITWYESFGVNKTNGFTRSSRRLFHAVMDPDNYVFNKGPVTRPSARQEVYNDKRANPEGRLWDDIWGILPSIPRVCGTFKEREADFPTQLPIKLLKTIVGCASNPGNLVVDPFSGSATTGAACLELGRRYIGVEISPDYVIKSRERMERVIYERIQRESKPSST